MAEDSAEGSAAPSAACSGSYPAARLPLQPTDVVEVPRHLLSRLLYPNPVCLLTTRAAEPTPPGLPATNIMTISWLTPTNNKGGLLLSMNAKRTSAALLASSERAPVLVLSVAVGGMEARLRAVGSCHGSAQLDKLAALGIPTCRPGWGLSGGRHGQHSSGDSTSSSGGQWPPAVADAAAHLVCRVEAQEEWDGHLLLRCQTEAGFVRGAMWTGKTWRLGDARAPGEAQPALLAFLGSQLFVPMS